MKRIIGLFIAILFTFIACINNVNAECQDEELNEWATSVEAVFTENTNLGSSVSKYAYFLSISPYREDVKIVVTDGNGSKANGRKFEEIDLYGVGAFTNLEEETYTIDVYGDKGSKCEGELLKRLSYTVPRFNRKVKDARCENNSDLEICKTFSNSTKNMTDEEFNKTINKYIEDRNPTTWKDVMKTIFSYGLFVIIPVLIVGVFYSRKIRTVKKEQKNR